MGDYEEREGKEGMQQERAARVRAAR